MSRNTNSVKELSSDDNDDDDDDLPTLVSATTAATNSQNVDDDDDDDLPTLVSASASSKQLASKAQRTTTAAVAQQKPKESKPTAPAPATSTVAKAASTESSMPGGTALSTVNYTSELKKAIKTKVPTSLDDEDDIDDILTPKRDIFHLLPKPLMTTTVGKPAEIKSSNGNTATKKAPPAANQPVPSTSSAKVVPAPAANQPVKKEAETKPKTTAPASTPSATVAKAEEEADDDDELPSLIPALGVTLKHPSTLTHCINLLGDAVFRVRPEIGVVLTSTDKDSPEFCSIDIPYDLLDVDKHKQVSSGFSLSGKNAVSLLKALKGQSDPMRVSYTAPLSNNNTTVSVTVNRCRDGKEMFKCETKFLPGTDKIPTSPQFERLFGENKKPVAHFKYTVELAHLLSTLAHLSQFGSNADLVVNRDTQLLQVTVGSTSLTVKGSLTIQDAQQKELQTKSLPLMKFMNALQKAHFLNAGSKKCNLYLCSDFAGVVVQCLGPAKVNLLLKEAKKKAT